MNPQTWIEAAAVVVPVLLGVLVDGIRTRSRLAVLVAQLEDTRAQLGDARGEVRTLAGRIDRHTTDYRIHRAAGGR